MILNLNRGHGSGFGQVVAKSVAWFILVSNTQRSAAIVVPSSADRAYSANMHSGARQFRSANTSADSAPHRRYAVAFAWFSPSDHHEDDVARRYCPMVMGLRGAAGAAAAALERSGVPSSEALDMLLLTNSTSITPEVKTFLEKRGVHIKGIEGDPLIDLIAKEFTSFVKVANVMKLATLWRTDWGYDAVFNADYDNFFSAGNDDLLTPAAVNNSFFVHNASMTPTNGGLFVAHPSEQLRNSVAAALQHGFSLTDGWGGNYSEDALASTWPHVQTFCESLIEHSCCDQTPRSPWCFAAADVDQGLLFHLAIDGGRKPGFPWKVENFDSLHTTLSPKPWEIEKLERLEETHQMRYAETGGDKIYFHNFEVYWNYVEPAMRKLFDGDEACASFYDSELALYQKRKERQSSS